MRVHSTLLLHAGLQLLASLPGRRTMLCMLPLLAFGRLPTAKADSTAAMDNTCAAAGPAAAPCGSGRSSGRAAADVAAPGSDGALAPLLAKLLGPNEFASVSGSWLARARALVARRTHALPTGAAAAAAAACRAV